MTLRTRVCGFEGGTPQQWKGERGTITNITATAGAARTGAYGCRIAPSASTNILQGLQNAPIATSYSVGRCYINLDVLPSADCTLMFWETTSKSYRLLFRSSDSSLRLEHRSSGVQDQVQDGPVIAADTWYRLDFLFSGQSSGSTRRMEWEIDGVAQPTVTDPGSSYLGGITFWTLGPTANATYTMFVDDITWVDNQDSTAEPERADTLALFPLGDTDGIKALKVTGSGTHDDQGVMAVTTGTLADSWQVLDQDPMTGTTHYVSQTTIDTDAYLEYIHEDLAADETPQYVQLYAGLYNGSNIAPSTDEVHVMDGGTDLLVIEGNPARDQVNAITGFIEGPWTRDQVNAYKTRYGYSDDVTPNPRCASLFFEVDYLLAPPVELGLHGALQLDGLVLPVRMQDGARYQEYGVLRPYADRHRPHVIGRKRVPDE